MLRVAVIMASPETGSSHECEARGAAIAGQDFNHPLLQPCDAPEPIERRSAASSRASRGFTASPDLETGGGESPLSSWLVCSADPRRLNPSWRPLCSRSPLGVAGGDMADVGVPEASSDEGVSEALSACGSPASGADAGRIDPVDPVGIGRDWGWRRAGYHGAPGCCCGMK